MQVSSIISQVFLNPSSRAFKGPRLIFSNLPAETIPIRGDFISSPKIFLVIEISGTTVRETKLSPLFTVISIF
jgi:hypothetical protein